MNPERALHFLADLHKAGWTTVIGPRVVCAVHTTWGGEVGRGDDFASMLDDLRKRLQARELCQ